MPRLRGEIESAEGENTVEYADVIMAAAGAAVLAWIADLLGGRRGLGARMLVAAVGAGCGWFLTVRVFAVATLDDWRWTPWSLAGAALCLIVYHLLRSKR